MRLKTNRNQESLATYQTQNTPHREELALKRLSTPSDHTSVVRHFKGKE